MNDADLDTLLSPSGQLYTGPVFDQSPVSSRLALTGQLNPVLANHYAAEHGRYLSGLGAAPRMKEQVIERDEHAEIYDLEQQDDVLGSGVFDPYHRPGTANTNTGVFTSHYSLPGYDARAVPFTVDSDVTDLTDDASIVHVPGGGMAYVEAKGRLVGPACPAMPPPPPGLTPARPTGRDQTYVDLTPCPPKGWDVESLLQQAEHQPSNRRLPSFPEPAGLPQFPHPGYMPPPANIPPAGPGAPGVSLPVPTLIQGNPNVAATTLPELGPAPYVSASASSSRGRPVRPPLSGLGSPAFPHVPGARCNYPFPPGHPARQPLWSVEQLPTRPRYRSVPGSPAHRRVSPRSMVNPMGARLAMGAADSGPPTWPMYLGAGIVAGVALRLFAGTIKKRTA
jgi:hypothetical protein